MKKYIILTLLLCSFITKAQISISWPVDRAVFQRANTNNTVVWFAGQCTTTWGTGYKMQYRIVSLDKYGNETNSPSWLPITLNTGKTFRFSLSQNTGWYRFYTRLLNGSQQQIGINSIKFGVGEVLVIAGQSNAAGEGVVSYGTANGMYDCIIASTQGYINKCRTTLPVFPVFGVLNPTYGNIPPNGTQPWAYELLGKKIVDRESGRVIPVMFFNAGLSGSSITQWNDSVNNPMGSYSTDPFNIDRCTLVQNGNGSSQGEPYKALKNTLNFYASLFGVRSIIWHQGESDNILNTTPTSINVYKSGLSNLISKTRSDFNPNLNWAVSKVSFNGNYSHENITTAQNDILTNTTMNTVLGTTSDNHIDVIINNILVKRRQDDKVHLNYAGLEKVANDYKITMDNLIAKTPVLPKPLPSLTINTTSIVAQSGFSCYQWVKNNGTYTNATYPNGCSGSNNTLVINATNAGVWRCYMKDATGNVCVSQAVTISFPAGARLAAATTTSVVYPNPVYKGFEQTISFEIPNEAHILLELIDQSGNVLQVLANGTHAVGKYNYPFSMNSFKTNDYEMIYYRLSVDGVPETKRILSLN